MTAPAGGAKSVFAVDMARVLDEKDKQLILPILSKGPVQNVIDLTYTRNSGNKIATSEVKKCKLQDKQQVLNFL